MPCNCRVKHKKVEGRVTSTTAYYPKPMARRICRLAGEQAEDT